MTDALRGPTGELRALPRRRAGEHDDEVDTDALEVRRADGTVFATVDATPIKQIVERSVYFRGPLPPPELLAEYERIHPGAAKALFDSFVQVQAHEQKMEERQMDLAETELRGDIQRMKRGQYLGFAIAAVVMIAAFVVILQGHDWVGGTIASLDLVGLAAIFVIGRFSDRTREEPSQQDDAQKPAAES